MNLRRRFLRRASKGHDECLKSLPKEMGGDGPPCHFHFDSESFTSFLNLLEEGLILLDGEGRVEYINRSGRKILDLDHVAYAEIKGRHILEVIRSTSLLEALQKTTEGIHAMPSVKISLKNNRTYNALIQPIYKGMVAIVIRPFEENKHVYTTSTLSPLQDAAHQFKTPLSAIRGYAETLLEAPGISEKARREFLEAILKNCTKLDRMTRSLLLLSRLNKQELKKGFIEFNIVELVEEIISSLVSRMENKGIRCKFTFEENDISIKGDRELISVAILNVLENAFEYSDNGQEIVVTLEVTGSAHADGDEGKDVVLKIKDSGPGIPKEEIEHIFTRFYRVKELERRHPGGSGLGLPIARDILRIHEGDIKVKSQWGKGTEVTMRLPFVT